MRIAIHRRETRITRSPGFAVTSSAAQQVEDGEAPDGEREQQAAETHAIGVRIARHVCPCG